MTAMLILGAAVWRGGPSPTLRRRTLHAAALYHAGRADLVIPCGGLGRFAPSEAQAMADLLCDAGVPRQVIVLEDRSTNTAQNLRNALPLLGGHTDVLIVSDAYHLPRARLLLRRMSRGARRQITTSAPKGGRLGPQLKGWLREGPALLAVLLRIR